MKYVLRCFAVSFLAVIFSFPAFADSSSTLPNSLAPTSVTHASPSNSQSVNINTADADSIASAHLKGIGKKRAADIVAYRQQHGPFKSVDDLKNIKGVGQKFIDANRDRITLS